MPLATRNTSSDWIACCAMLLKASSQIVLGSDRIRAKCGVEVATFRGARGLSKTEDRRNDPHDNCAGSRKLHAAVQRDLCCRRIDSPIGVLRWGDLHLLRCPPGHR